MSSATLNDTGIISLYLRELRSTTDALIRHLSPSDLPLFLSAHYGDAVLKLEQAIQDLTCECCSEPVTVMREAGNFCAACSALFAVCHGCGTDVRKSESVSDALGFDYHGACIGPVELDKEHD